MKSRLLLGVIWAFRMHRKFEILPLWQGQAAVIIAKTKIYHVPRWARISAT
jgi:hypothetical protein